MRQLFADPEVGRLTGDAKRACEKLGIKVEDLLKKTPADIKLEAKHELEPLTQESINIRLHHFELRRRKKLKLAADAIKLTKN